jgi:NAD(P)-dependent dehydrogenase (short-subunit alcohol dehydrogenase family)
MTDRTVLVTGAAGGIGRAVVLASAQRGWRVAALDIDESGAQETVALARSAGAPQAVAVRADVSDEQSIDQAFEEVVARIGLPTGVVANAGIEVNAPIERMRLDDWNRVLSVNLTGVFLTVRAAVRRLRSAERPGSLVCTSSPSAFVGFAGGGNSAYGSSKGGITAFVRSVAIDLAAHGIRVNGLVPGATETPILLAGVPESERAARTAEIAAHAAAQIPMGRLADPMEVAAAAVWLLGDESSYVTGSNLVCDGGLLAKSANDF